MKTTPKSFGRLTSRVNFLQKVRRCPHPPTPSPKLRAGTFAKGLVSTDIPERERLIGNIGLSRVCRPIDSDQSGEGSLFLSVRGRSAREFAAKSLRCLDGLSFSKLGRSFESAPQTQIESEDHSAVAVQSLVLTQRPVSLDMPSPRSSIQRFLTAFWLQLAEADRV